MSGTKRDSSHIDNDYSNDNDQSQPTISSSSHTPANSPQNPIYISSTPPAESVMSTPASTGDQPTETSTVTNDSGTGSDPGSSNPSNASAKKGRGKREAIGSKKSQSNDNNNGGSNNDDETAAKRPSKRRREDEPKRNYAEEMLQKKNKSGRVAQACDRCHKCRFGCDESRHGCVLCLRDGCVCTMTNRVTGEIIVRGGKAGVKVDFGKMQDDNIDLTENNRKLNQEIEQLRTENSNLRSQLGYHQGFSSSIGVIPGPNNAPPVSILSGNFPNPQPQAMQQPNPHLSTNPQPLPANYTTMNNNAFSGNMSINTPSNVPNLSFGAPMSNALPFPQWAQPNLSQGLPVAPQNTAVAYPPNFYQVPSLQDNQPQAIPFQNANNNQGMGYQDVPVQNFQYPPGLQVPGTQYLPMPRPLGTPSLNAQNQNQNQNNPPSQPVQAMPAQRQDSNVQDQNNQNFQGQGVQEAYATQNQTNQSQTTYQNQGMGYPQNQIPQNQNLQPMTTQYSGTQMQNTNAHHQGMGNSNALNQGIQVPNTQAHNINTQFPGFQFPNNIQSQPQNANAHQNFANSRPLYQMPQESLFGGGQNQGMLFQPPQAFQQPSFQIPGTQYQGIASQNLGGQGLGYMNTQNPFPQAQGPPPTSNNPAAEGGNSSSGNDADAEGESESEEYSWTPQPRAGGQYVTANTETQQTNTGGENSNNNNNNRQGEQSTLPNTTTTNIQTQAIRTETVGGFGNPFDLTDTDTTLNNGIVDQSPDLSTSEMQRLLGELETGTRYDYTQGEQNNDNNNGGQEKDQEIELEQEVDVKPEVEVKLEGMDFIKDEKD